MENPTQNPQNPQTQNPQADQSIFDKLEQRHQIAMQLRLAGSSYYMIANELTKRGIPLFEDTVRHWFAKGGVCNELYTKLKTDALAMLAKELEEGKQELKQGALESIGIIRQAARGEITNELQISAAKDILDRAGFPKQTKVEQSGEVNIPAITETANAVKAIAESLKVKVSKSLPLKPAVNPTPVKPALQNPIPVTPGPAPKGATFGSK